ncbi:MAG: NmrA family NAD(P)-binding protein, partial [Cyanobacteria bacterium]|nr:NmrA family NAD(P)-binding protein [Cyanobacteriota bacterium]
MSSSARKLMLVLGATGFLGRQVIDRMLAANHAIRVVTRGATDWQDTTINELRKSGIEVIIG